MSSDQKNVHKGHRQRLKARFLKDGLDNFEEHQVLELLLFYAIPQRDTNPIAHALMERFGSLANVLDAPAEELAEVDYMGENAVTLLKMVTALCRTYQVSSAARTTQLMTIDECGRYLLPYFYARQHETVFLLCLDAKCAVLCCEKVGEGGVNSAGVSLRAIVEKALKVDASSAVLAHNHPGGLALPSREDLLTTRRVAAALDAVNVQLMDHIIVAEDDWVSLFQSGMYRYEDCRLEV